ncbi:tetratricopeptide repeat protein [Polynucleobacter sp. UK-Mo-2m-Kol15]|uniref:tetratricopeptide repeat protein n=1 Tax=Polynucleobacter sp. UK-Mo-2m-Kol15 TaxID=2576916 RepID=UPI001C0D6DE1|nr:tetratricopeptide repeat protein [Polynucleobacter sp. UK-Mo-2m-Kol15]MBU3575927.1 tetratricopeptide repeat protein [Polynucleobacter sp. UK-Mo-2m-Kol15]
MNTATSPATKEMIISRGLESFISGSYSQATMYFEEILSDTPNDPDALHHLAGCQIQLQEFESALKTIQKVLNIESKNSLAWFRLGQIHYICKRYELAVDSFGKAIEIKPDFADAWFMGGQALIQNGAINDGMLALENALLLNSSSVIFNEIFAKHYIDHKRDVGTLVITGGIGDILLCLPFLLQNKDLHLKINVLTHFKGAKRIFDSLSIPVNKIAYYSNDAERLKLQPEIIGPREFYPCPKRWFLDINPFDSKIISLDSARPTIGVQLGGSAISIDMQSKIGLPKKSLPVSLLQNILSINAFNVILFGSKEEIESYGLLENKHLHHASYQNIDESLSLVSLCDCFVGSDSAIKSITAMLQIPTFVWMGDYQDPYRDTNFIDPFAKKNVFEIFRYRDITQDEAVGTKKTFKFFNNIGLIESIPNLPLKEDVKKIDLEINNILNHENQNQFISSRGLLKSCNSHNRKPISSNAHIDDDLLREHKNGGSIYICTDALLNFSINYLPKITETFTLLSGDSDIRVDSSMLNVPQIKSILSHPKLRQWYAQNLDVDHAKIQPLPIGMDYHTMHEKPNFCGPGIQSALSQEQDLLEVINTSKNFKERKFLGYCNWSNSINNHDRALCIERIQKELCYFEHASIPRIETWKNQANHMFVISPEGIGMDCHRTWEALLLGCVPVVKKNNHNLFKNLPVWEVNDWSEFNATNILEKIQYFCELEFDYSALFLSYWSSLSGSSSKFDLKRAKITGYRELIVDN